MGLPVLKKSICGISLEVGSLIIGYLNLVSPICLTIACVILFVISANPEVIPTLVDNKQMGASDSASIAVVFGIVGAVLAVLALVSLTIVILLLVGIHKKDHRFMLPWLILEGIACILGLISLGIFFIFGLAYAFQSGEHFLGYILQLFVNTSCNIFSCYIFLVVYNCYRSFKHPPISNTLHMGYGKVIEDC